MIKFIYNSESEIPDGLKDNYKEEGGKYVLQVDGAVPKARLDEFRNRNVEITNKLATYEGVDLEKYKALIAKETELAEGKLIKTEGLDAAVNARLAKVQAEHAKALEAVTKRATQAEERLAAITIQQALVEPATKAGLVPTAMSDLAERAAKVWRLKNGAPVAIGADGQEIYGATGMPITMADWIGSLLKEAPHLFAPSAGSGAAPHNGQVANNGANPWKRETWNITEQMRLSKQSPEQAARLKAAAAKTS